MIKRNLTEGNITKTLLLFSLPMIAGNLLQQIYNLVDTWIVGNYLGTNALASVGSAYTLMTFLNSIIIGLCMGSGAATSYYFGKKEKGELKRRVQISFMMIGLVTLAVNGLIFAYLDHILALLHTPTEIYALMRSYVFYIFFGLIFTFLYNFCAFILRGMGNSFVPLMVLAAASVINIVLDYWFVVGLSYSVAGAAVATVLAQAFSGIAMVIYTWKKLNIRFLPERGSFHRGALREMIRLCAASCIQQSVMNFGILMIQGLVNSFGTSVMAAFSAAVKIDTLAYMPAQEFGNAYSLYISQNFGAGKSERVSKGTKTAIEISVCFCILVSVIVVAFSQPLLGIFIQRTKLEIIAIGKEYLLLEGSFYFAIGILFLLYGYFRGINRPEMSLILTIISLGTRVVLAYTLARISSIGVWGIWVAIPIGWGLADFAGLSYMAFLKRKAIRRIC